MPGTTAAAAAATRGDRPPRAPGPLAVAAVLAAAALTAAPAAFAGGGTNRRRRRAEAQRAQAQEAKDAAAQSFYELDTAQRDIRISVETIAAVDTTDNARRAVADFDTLVGRINEVSTAYIDTLDRHDLDAEELEASDAQAAQRELAKAREDLDRARSELDRYAAAIAPLVEKAEERLARVTPAVEGAKRSWLAATEAVEAVKATGLRTEELMARLVALNPGLKALNEGAAAHGVDATLQQAAEVQRSAEAVRAEADRLPERAQEIDRRVRSLRTRMDAVSTKLGQVQPTLSELRRRFAASCWQDLQNVDQQARRALQTADERLREAGKARDEQRWADATGALGTVRALLDDADAAAVAPGGRLRSLNEVERDPQGHLEKARFAVRDAQRLAMAGRAQPDPRHARPLDEAVGRIERLEGRLEGAGRHPDYWAYLREVDAIKDTAARVVQAIREERAGGH